MRLENQYFALDLDHSKGQAVLDEGVCAFYVPSSLVDVKLELFAVLRAFDDAGVGEDQRGLRRQVVGQLHHHVHPRRRRIRDREGPAGTIAFAYGRDTLGPNEATSAFLVFRKGGLE